MGEMLVSVKCGADARGEGAERLGRVVRVSGCQSGDVEVVYLFRGDGKLD